MEKKVYITDEERDKCPKVAKAFAELENSNIVVVDVGRYGFIKLEYNDLSHIFEDVITFTDSQELFEDLWYEWLCIQMDLLVKDTPLTQLDYDDIFKCLPKEKQEELMDKKVYFARKTGIGL